MRSDKKKTRKPKAAARPAGPVQAGSNTYRLLAFVAGAVAERLARGGDGAVEPDKHGDVPRRPRRERTAGGPDGH